MGNLVNLEKIENYRKINYLSKTEFCKLSNISLSTYKNIFERKNFRIVALFKIAKVLNINVCDLFI